MEIITIDKKHDGIETGLENFISFDKSFTELFKQLGLKPILIQLFRAFLIISKGNIEFETSFSDLAKILYSTNGKYDSKLIDRIRYAQKELQNWQNENGITLIQVIEKGQRNSTPDGRFTYVKTKYRFVLLEELNKEIQGDSDNIEHSIQKTITQLKDQFLIVDKTKKYPSGHLMKKAKNTVLTKMKKIYELAIESEIDAENYCRNIINQCLELVINLQSQHRVEQNRHNFLAEFRRKYLTKTVETNSFR